MRKLRAVVIGLSLALSLSGCDENSPLVQKSVSILGAEGHLNFDPDEPMIMGDVTYEIQNIQTNGIQEVYFISHGASVLESASYNGSQLRIDESLSYGFSIYRVRIPLLSKGDSMRLSIRFHVKGVYRSSGFKLSPEMVHFEAEKIWLPVPYAQKEEFLYSFILNTPEEYYPVMSARLTSEKVGPEGRVTLWQSETEDIFQTGNLIIGKFRRYHTGNVYYYSSKTNQVDTILESAQTTRDLFQAYLGKFPFSDTHILTFERQEELIDGLAEANMIQISPDLVNNAGQNLPDLKEFPDIPRGSVWKIHETLAHELSHAYIRGTIRFNENNYIESESLAEFMGLMSICSMSPDAYQRFIERNRLELLNLSLLRKGREKLYRYLFGINCLSASFNTNTAVFFQLIKNLENRYRFTQISTSELIQTAEDLDLHTVDTETATNQTSAVLSLWFNYQMANFSLRFQENRQLSLSNGFPIPWNLQINQSRPDALESVYLAANSATNLNPVPSESSVLISSPLWTIESRLYDNFLSPEISPLKEYFSVIAAFYAGERKKIPTSTAALPQGWKTIQADRDWHSRQGNPKILLRIDDMKETDRHFTIQAFKEIDGKIFSCCIIWGEKQNRRYRVIGVIDPVIASRE